MYPTLPPGGGSSPFSMLQWPALQGVACREVNAHAMHMLPMARAAMSLVFPVAAQLFFFLNSRFSEAGILNNHRLLLLLNHDTYAWVGDCRNFTEFS